MNKKIVDEIVIMWKILLNEGCYTCDNAKIKMRKFIKKYIVDDDPSERR